MTNLSTPLIESAHGRAAAGATMQRPGPDILYAPPADAPQLQNTGVWVAPPILISGAARYDQGEYLYQDYLYDDHGGAGLPDLTDPHRAGGQYTYSPKAGTATYPTDPVYANNAADLVEFRTKPLPDQTAFRLTLNTLQNPELVGFTLAIGTSETPRAWPNQAGVRSPAAYFLTVHGGTAQLLDAATGALITPTPTVHVDQPRRQFEVRVPHTAWDPGDSTVRLAAGIGLWDATAGHYLVPGAIATPTTPGGRSASGSALFNLAFRFHEPIPEISTLGGLDVVQAAVAFATMPSFWREQAQARALATGDISEFSADVDFGKLAARVHDDSGVPTTGPVDRILASRFSYGQGVDYSKTRPRCPATAEGIFRGQLQPYALYVPASPPPSGGWGTTLLLHALSTNYNLFLGSDYQAQLGDRGDALVISPGGRGPDGDYRDVTEADVFEVWADVARHYDLNPRRATVTGFSMGGGGTFRLLARYPDLFAAGAAVSAVGSGTDADPGSCADEPGPDLASLRNNPVLTWIGAFDEGTWVPRQAEFRKAEANLGLRFVFDTFLTADHLTLATIDDYTPLVDYLAGYRIDPNPPHVTYCVDPRTDSAQASVVADHAYWLSRLTVRDQRQSLTGTGTIDARSEAFGVADPVPSGVSTSSEILPVTHEALPYERNQQSWGPAPSTTPENTLALNLTNIGQATIDGARAKLTGNAPVTLNISSDGPATITLALALPLGTTVITRDGQRTAPPVTATTTGVTLTVGPGTSTYLLTPPQPFLHHTPTPSIDDGTWRNRHFRRGPFMSDQDTPSAQQISQALNAAGPSVLAWGPRERPTRVPLLPDEVWELPNGTAWVYYGEGNHGLTRPVIIADGARVGPSDPVTIWATVDWAGYPFLSEIRRRGRDVVVLGYHDGSAKIQDNAQAALAAIQRAIQQMSGDHNLAVGGFSMGGLVTRYALLQLEHQRMDHRTALYFSYDSPHRGAWFPIALQAFAHYIKDLSNGLSSTLNSPAVQQLAPQHISDWRDTPGTSKLRTELLDELDRLGNWPVRPRKIGVSNGVGTGVGNGIQPGATALRGEGLAITGTNLFAQSQGENQLVAQLRVVTLQEPEIRTSGLPDIDGAPGSTLESFGLIADLLSLAPVTACEALIREPCFIPAVSAVDLRDITTHDDLYTPVDDLPPRESGLDAYKLSSQNVSHPTVTEELGSWIIDQLP